MATTVGATLASSKLVVTQGDLYLVGSPVNQLVLYFDQATFDKLLATARVKANKAEKHRHKTRATGAQYILAASSPHRSLSSHRRRAALESNDGPISTSVWSRICHPDGKVRALGGPSYPQRSSCDVDHRARRQRVAEGPGPSQRPVRYYDIPRNSPRHATQAKPTGLGTRATLVPSLLKGVGPRTTGCTSTSRCRGKIPSEGKSQRVLKGVRARRASKAGSSSKGPVTYMRTGRTRRRRLRPPVAEGNLRRMPDSSTPEIPHR